MVEIYFRVNHGRQLIIPPVTGEVIWETARKGQPGKLTFSVLDDNLSLYQEGTHICLTVDGKDIFYGFLFEKSREKEGIIKMMAYDQLRYLKNKDIYSYENKTASEVIQMLSNDFHLKTGILEDTGYRIPSRIEDNQSLFDIILTALEETLMATGKLYVLYDDFGAMTLKNIQNMLVNLLIDEETAEDYDYKTSIDSQTYNQIKLTLENDETGKREIYIVKDNAHINEWGVLQEYQSIQKGANGQAIADSMLKLYNKKSQSLSIKNAFGDVRVRGGSLLPIMLNLGDKKLNNFMLVENVKHKFEGGSHVMDLTLGGNNFYG